VQKLITRCALLAALTLAGPVVSAQDVAPDVLLKTVTSEVISIIKQDKATRSGKPAQLDELVHSQILPLFDFSRMTELAAAQNWRVATPEQQKALTSEFKTLLVRTYSTALQSYRGEMIEFKAPAARGDAEVTVRSILKQSGSDPLSMDYDMERTAQGWKVYEIRIDGVNLIANYRGTFAAKVRDGGVDGLIKALADKNRS
jgi:phospholipid transport system substrate-binding protein